MGSLYDKFGAFTMVTTEVIFILCSNMYISLYICVCIYICICIERNTYLLVVYFRTKMSLKK